MHVAQPKPASDNAENWEAEGDEEGLCDKQALEMAAVVDGPAEQAGREHGESLHATDPRYHRRALSLEGCAGLVAGDDLPSGERAAVGLLSRGRRSGRGVAEAFWIEDATDGSGFSVV
ncbi:hypothetical protein SCAR479_10475 [Seiridium cardinale]|uniref:Uncharacterized protein n=1 Tax=Seiridium cardinale TaxID=138064 RepID=A0ABR2XGJ1_9PEZI